MCLIAFAWQASARFPLVVAGNRDEFFARPTASADWSVDGGLLSGRDLRGGGTWMGVTRDGRFAALTNHRNPSATNPGAPSRGELVDRVLTARDVDATVATILAERTRFNGFNLVAARWGDTDALVGIAHPGPMHVQSIAAGVHGLSNAQVDTDWPKVVAIRAALADALATDPGPEALIDDLFAALQDEHVASDDALPETGVTRDVERALSAAFIRMPGYGTRSSTVLLVDRDGHATFVERRHEPDAPIDERRFDFATPRFVRSASPSSATRAT